MVVEVSWVINGSNRLTTEGYQPEWLCGESYFIEGEAELPRWVDLALNMCLVVETIVLFTKHVMYLHFVLTATSALHCASFHLSAVLLL